MLFRSQTQVVVRGDGHLAYQTMRLSSPDRLVIDFSGTRPRMAEKTIAANAHPVRGVRVGQFKPGVTRVVIDLGMAVSYQVTPSENAITVTFSAPVAAASAGPVKKANPVREAPPQVANVTPVHPERGRGAQPVEEKPAVAPKEVSQPVTLPATITQKGALATAEPAATPAEPAPVPAAPEKKAETPSTPAPVAPASPVPQGQQPKYAGEPISVNLKDVDLKDFFRLIHEISGLNVVVDPNVKGTLTIVLEDVPWDQALEIVLRNNGLDKQLEGNVLRIATRDTLKKEAELRRDLQKAQAEAVDQITQVRVLSYAKASTMRDTLKRFLSSRGEILADERSNTLIIRDIPSVFPDIDNLIRQLDRRTQQVEIEARVVTATRTFRSEERRVGKECRL